MKPQIQKWSTALIALTVPLWLIALSATAAAQHGGGAHAGGGGHGGTGGSGQMSGGSRGAAQAGWSAGAAVPRVSGESTWGTADLGMLGTRPSNGYPIIGSAVARPGGLLNRPGSLSGAGNYYGWLGPWAFGGLGLYGAYDLYGGNDAFLESWSDPLYGGYSNYSSPVYPSNVEGAIHLKVKPSDAMVFVDGNYVGIVDEYDGIFQRLHLNAGPHRVEVLAAGYGPLSFNLMVQPNQTTTYRGALAPIR